MITACVMTHVGRVRARNEDTIVVPGLMSLNSLPGPLTLSYPNGGSAVFAVIDGMGGHRGGQMASRIVAQAMADEDLAVAAALEAANRATYDAAAKSPELSGMGATIAGVAISGSAATAFNVGDSRVYQHSGGYSVLVSTDDKRAPGSNVVTQSIGGADRLTAIAPHLVDLTLARGDRLLICSDGLTEMVGFDDIQTALSETQIQAAVETLLRLTFDAGAEDNVSIVLIQWDDKIDQARLDV